MFVELHLLQNFAPSNLNRDDTSAPKDCTFGGFRRARISSQCMKRAIRHHDSFKSVVQAVNGDVGQRTKRLLQCIVDHLTAQGHDAAMAEKVGEAVIKGAGLAFDEKTKKDSDNPALSQTQYLLYLSNSEIAALGELAHEHWETLSKLEVDNTATDKDNKKQRKKAGKKALSPELSKAINDIFKDPPRLAADIALFGRMVADGKNMNVDAACQMAHALSTNEIAMEMDFFTAVDDLLLDEQSGSGMLGIIEFNSACYYRYAQINLDILKANLAQQGKAVAIAAVEGFIKAAILATPTGMQNSLTAQNPPSYIRVLVRSSGAPWALTNAFIKPIRADQQHDLISQSVDACTIYFQKLQDFYGTEGFDLDLAGGVDVPLTDNTCNFKQLITGVTQHLDNHWTDWTA